MYALCVAIQNSMSPPVLLLVVGRMRFAHRAGFSLASPMMTAA